MKSSGQRAEPRISILTPGPLSLTYFEQAYLARYLGFLLVEGEDLVMRDGRIFVRTIAGLKQCDVIWRHIDADWCDPLELNASSRIGVPGLLEAIRNGGVAVENMPGAGLVESRALLAFLPVLARRLLDQDLLIPNIATWWCGQPRERERVLDEFDKISIAAAFGDELPGLNGQSSVVAAEMPANERERLRDAIAVRGIDYVGQDIVRLSTTPRWTEGKLEPRPFVLRVYCAATTDGWRVMPGGFCRISDRADARAVAMGDGVESADVWVLAENPVEVSSLLPSPESARITRLLGNLPSRAADNLFWFGRYLERAEATLRVVRCLSARSVDPDAPVQLGRQSLDRLMGVLVGWGAVDPAALAKGAAAASEQGLRNAANYGSALSLAHSARNAASVIRERLTHQTWALIGRLEVALKPARERRPSAGEIVDLADEALTTIAALSGLFDENFNRGAGWVFYEMGRCVERGANTCRLLRQFAGHDATEHSLGVMLDLIDSQITYRSRYLVGMALAPVRDMALLDPFNPRSVAFQVNRIDEGIGTLPVLRRDGMLEEPRRLTTLLRAELTTERAELLDDSRILAIEQGLLYIGERHRRPVLPARSRSGPSGESHGTGVIYEITHVTRYTYGAIVELTTGVLRLTPVSGDGQEVERFSIVTDPLSQPLTERLELVWQPGHKPPDREAPPTALRSRRHHAFASIERPPRLQSPAWETVAARGDRGGLARSRLPRNRALSVSSRFAV